MITNNIGTFARQQQFFSGKRASLASCLCPTERKSLSIQVLARTEPITHLAQDYNVSRKFGLVQIRVTNGVGVDI